MATPAVEPERIPPDVCANRLRRLYELWDSFDTLKDCDALLLLTGRAQDQEEIVRRRGLFHLWVFALVFPETFIILFKDKRVAFSARESRLVYFTHLKDTEVEEVVKLEFYLREDKSFETLQKLFKTGGLGDTISKCVVGDDSSKPPRIGTLLHPESIPYSSAAEMLMSLLGFPKRGVESLDSEGFNTHADEDVLPQDDFHLNLRWRAVDDDISRLCLRLDKFAKESAQLVAVAAARMVREVIVKRVVHILDHEVQEGHSRIAQYAEAALDDTAKMSKWRANYGIDPSQLDIAYCLVESGGHFTLDPQSKPTEQPLNLGRGSICIGLGMKYTNYATSNICRTLLMEVSKPEKELYKATLVLQNHIVSLLKPSKTFAQVFEEAMAYAKEKHPVLAKYVEPCFGGILGINTVYMDGFKFDAASTNNHLTTDMALTVAVTAPNIALEPDKPPVAMWLADTYLLKDTGAEILTGQCMKQLTEIHYAIEEEKENVSQQEERKAAPPAAAKAASRNAPNDRSVPPRTRSRRAMAGASQAEAEKLINKQRELRRKKQDELKERFRNGGVGFAKDKKDVRKLAHTTAYRDFSEFPKDLRPNKIHLDPVRETVLIPVGQHHVPFHVSTIRSVSHQDEDGSKTHILRISFQVPGATTGTARNEESPLPDLSATPNALFIKEIIIRSCDQNVLNLFKNFRELLKKARTKEANRREEDVTQQQALTLNRNGRRIFLRNLMVRHSGGHSRKVIGQLEAHTNGFRYLAPRCENIDLIYSNIAHAFFQPVKNEPTILLHFTLKSPIIISKKKVKEVQFFTEAASTADDLDARRGRSTFDPDEFLEEEREMERKKKLNADFKRFVEQVQESAPIEFEIPMRNLSFYGVPKSSTVVIMPTQNCLINLEWPVFILPIEDVELVSFERVIDGLRHFDMIFVQKNYTKPVVTVNTIPVESLDMLKAWLNDMDIVWYEGKKNLSWHIILKTIRADITKFVEDGGFNNFMGDEGDGSSASSSSDDEEDEEYQESSSASDGSGSESSSEEEGSGDEDGSDESDGSGADSEEDEDEEDEDEDDDLDDDEDEDDDEPIRKKRKGGDSGDVRASKKRRSF
eukprot:Blabericola_migrator_1__3116@NODE_1908_length_3578_cov_140_638280_g1220_i0_p1_GENE_NODE_1908_length_3578_cov_140_638280_g1220_i0NODE_1908_length_3578_cov_140_638280_g1220_i0_p1_ORF_typecomplete_len1094_score252_58SPT16/PF08644_11/3_4e03SPT16/PF08644_11/2_7e42Rtt106/PF08512_12/1_3e16FACTSpt16_Nlob/PF14826_6/1_4e12Peptidase_M24/PF00557_24/1e07LAP1C/PF05609_12/1_2e02LAP1C/PF05609_12/0_045_NODE_1908_length_3578_cov_140_638280_g1220_i01653446